MKFIGFVKPSFNRARAEAWVQIVQEDRPDFTIDSIKKWTFICENHFDEKDKFDLSYITNQSLTPIPILNKNVGKRFGKTYSKKQVSRKTCSKTQVSGEVITDKIVVYDTTKMFGKT